MIKRKINKHGQIAVFVILGLIIITSIILLLFLRKGPELIVPDEENPEAFIESCTKEDFYTMEKTLIISAIIKIIMSHA